MNETALFEELCTLLVAAGIEIRTERFHLPPDSAGGLCRLAGKHLVLLHAGASKAERARALLEVVEQIGLNQLGLSGSQLSPALLARLNRRGQMPWPHRSQAPPVAKPIPNPRSHHHLKLVMPPDPLSTFTTMALGGPPQQLDEVKDEGELIETVRSSTTQKLPLYILGGGSNIVAADSGVDGVVARILIKGIQVKEERGRVLVTVAAGENWSEFVQAMVKENYAGLECLGGIPGSVGATPIQNVGAYGQEVSQTIHEVRVLNRTTLKMRTLKNSDCRFAYRSSLFKTNAVDEYVVVSVTFALKPGGRPQLNYSELKTALGAKASLSATHDAVIALRQSKSMVYDPRDENHRSCGSFFVNAQVTETEADFIDQAAGTPIPRFSGDRGRLKVPSAWLIEKAGIAKGQRFKNVGLSTKHTLCLVAHPHAKATELIEFAAYIRSTVENKFRVRLVPEPNFWGFSRVEDRLPLLD